MMTIGEFARATKLSAKALRRYGDMGLVPPATVDPYSGYRYYRDEQIDTVRLIVWLRRIGMPLARIREVLAADSMRGAEIVRGYWDEVEATTAANRRLVDFLVDRFTGKVPTMTFTLNYAMSSTQGMRDADNDRALLEDGVLAVADGFGGSGVSEEVLAGLSSVSDSASDSVSTEGEVVDMVNELFAGVYGATSRGLDGVGTTLTALVRVGDHLGLVHIGDTRAYLLRDGELRQITTDHTWVRSLVEQGRLTEDEARVHPDRALLTRALTKGGDFEAQVGVLDARVGDRYLLCSDGVHSVVDEERILAVLVGEKEVGRACGVLVKMAGGEKAVDNCVAVVADLC